MLNQLSLTVMVKFKTRTSIALKSKLFCHSDVPVAARIIGKQIDNAHHFITLDPFVISFQLAVRPGYLYCGTELKSSAVQHDNELSLHQGNWVPIQLTPL